MTVRVYQFHLDPPHEGLPVVARTMAAAHRYSNDLVAIERGRRAALRAITDRAVEERAAFLAATRSTRKDALARWRTACSELLATTRCEGGHWAIPEEECERYPYSPLYEDGRIALLDASLRRDARALTETYWGTYLLVERAADQIRRSPLYDDVGEPNDPRFRRWADLGVPLRVAGSRAQCAGQIGMQIQGGLPTSAVYACMDTRVHVERDPESKAWATLSLRVGSEGRAPVWARWRMRMHREVPDAGRWKWVAVSRRANGSGERWTVEITVDDPAPPPRSLDTALDGILAVEVAWDKPKDRLIVARWRDDRGGSGQLTMPAYDEAGISKSASFRSIRDTLLNDLRPNLARAIERSADVLPVWLASARDALLEWTPKSIGWHSPYPFRELYYRWHVFRCDAARGAFELLDAWEKRDRHLLEYETGMRKKSLRRRREGYRVQAARWSRQYKTIVLDDRMLSREARFGEAADLRQIAAPYELREALRSAFGADAITYPWRDRNETEDDDEDDDRDWCERAIDAQKTGGARSGRKPKKTVHGEGGAWASRKARKGQRGGASDSARTGTPKGAQ
jgi:hypothetical protein